MISDIDFDDEEDFDIVQMILEKYFKPYIEKNVANGIYTSISGIKYGINDQKVIDDIINSVDSITPDIDSATIFDCYDEIVEGIKNLLENK